METKTCSEIDQHKLKLMKSIVHTQDPTSKVEVDDQILKRFLYVRKLDVYRASDSFLKYLKWIRVVAPNGLISKVEIPNELAQNKIFVQGFDKKGRPIAVVFFGKHVATKGKESLDELKRLMVYLLDKICARMPSGQEQFTCIGDLTGWGFSSSDLNGCLAIVSVLQDYYPKRLGQVYFLHQPYIFTTMWKIISTFIPHKTKKRIVFVENKKVTSTLLQDIDENELPEIYGGKISLVPVEDS